ncbi:acylphosphatase [Rhizobium sp. KVB221]|uniref:acylphosphatase n=1 Tax=Rhizobium setariae TaxID=2801340 RepID=A0A937CK31_9HYPH|nr:acylphosphatase [Rhizobium setariae]MBL0371735.1 acylphosphatase [Rhizobium setariae]
MATDIEAVLVRIRGRVQGVSYRVWTADEARRLGLTGWVRNEADGSVLAMIAGPNEAIASMIKRFWDGPPGAMVSDVRTESVAISEIPAKFHISG